MLSSPAALVGCILYGLAFLSLSLILMWSCTQMAWRWAFTLLILLLNLVSQVLFCVLGLSKAGRAGSGLTAVSTIMTIYTVLQFLIDFQRNYFGWSSLAPSVTDEDNLPPSVVGGCSTWRSRSAKQASQSTITVVRSDGVRLRRWEPVLSAVLLLNGACTIVSLAGSSAATSSRWGNILGIVNGAMTVALSLVILALTGSTSSQVRRRQQELKLPTRLPAYLILLLGCFPFVVATSAGVVIAFCGYVTVYFYLSLVSVLVTCVLLTSTVAAVRYQGYGAGAIQISDFARKRVESWHLGLERGSDNVLVHRYRRTNYPLPRSNDRTLTEPRASQVQQASPAITMDWLPNDEDYGAVSPVEGGHKTDIKCSGSF